MVLSEAIEDYGQFIRHELGHATTTYHAYVSWQRNCARWLAENGLPDPLVTELSESLVRRYSYSRSSRGLRPRTIRGALHALRSLFGYLADRGAVSGNPAKEVRLPKKDAATRLLVTDDDLVKLLEEIKAITGLKGDPRIKPHSIRHAAATRLMHNGADIRSIQAWLGHSRLQTTAIYLHTDEQQVRKSAPLAGIRPADPEKPSPTEPTDRASFHSRRRMAR